MNKEPFRNPELYRTKGTDRININNLLAAVCVTILTLLVTVPTNRVNFWSILQLAIAIPCLITSSLCYAKFAYRPIDEMNSWDFAGWLTHSVGYACVVNATAVLLDVANYGAVAWIFIITNIVLFLAYAVIDVMVGAHRLREKVWKTLLYLTLLICGGIIPLCFGVG